MSMEAALPDNLDACQQALLQTRGELAHVQHVLGETATACDELHQELARLKEELELFKRLCFGRRSERFIDDPNQGRLFAEPEAVDAAPPAADDPAHVEEIIYRRRRQGHGWSPLPEHLPRQEVLVDLPPDQQQCPDCGQALVRIGEDRSERVDIIPARVIVKVIVRPKYACPHQHGIVQQELPPSPVPGGRFDFGFTAHVLTTKLADHVPLYRQQNQLARSGLTLGRSTLCEILTHSAVLLEPLASLMKRQVLLGDLLGADDTPVRTLDRSHPDGVRLARLWLFRGPEAAPYNLFHFHESRSRDGPADFLQTFRGTVKVDAYGVNNGVYLSSDGRIVASCCWAHARRKFDEAKSSHPRLAAEALAIIQQLYDLEDRARAFTAEERRALRQREATPLLERFRTWLDEQAATALPKLKFGEAVGYARNQWSSLVNYVEDGRLPIDNNDVERDLRALTIGRKNWLFIGAPTAGPRAAVLYTVVASAARHNLDIWAYLRDVLERLAEGGVALADLLPDAWAKTHPESVHEFRRQERETRAAAQSAHRQARRQQAQAHPAGKGHG
jgi:transposase